MIEDDPGGRILRLTKDGINVGNIFIILQFRSLADLRAGLNFSETDFDTQGLDTAESVYF